MEVQVNKEIKEYRSHLKTYYKANRNNYPALEENYNKLEEQYKTLSELYDNLESQHETLILASETIANEFNEYIENMNDLLDENEFYSNVYKYSAIGMLLVILVPYIWMLVDSLYNILIK